MAFFALPPDAASCAGDDVGGGEAAVFGGVPFFGKGGIEAFQIVVAGLHAFVGTDGAACAADAGFDDGPPLVAVPAAPPNEAVAAGQNLVRCQAAVFRGVPLFGDVGIEGGEIGFAGNGQTAAAIGTASAAAGANVDGGLPVMAVGAGPPDFAFAAVADGVGGQGLVACAVPFVQKAGPLFTPTELGETFTHNDHLLFFITKLTFCDKKTGDSAPEKIFLSVVALFTPKIGIESKGHAS